MSGEIAMAGCVPELMVSQRRDFERSPQRRLPHLPSWRIPPCVCGEGAPPFGVGLLYSRQTAGLGVPSGWGAGTEKCLYPAATRQSIPERLNESYFGIDFLTGCCRRKLKTFSCFRLCSLPRLYSGVTCHLATVTIGSLEGRSGEQCKPNSSTS